MTDTLQKPTDWDELYPGRFFKAGDLRGEHLELEISAVDLEMLESDKGARIKGTLKFRNQEKGLALNKTNGSCLKAMFGRSVQQWVGKRVVFFPTTTKLGPKTEPCIRIFGSPDIASDMTVEIVLPKRKPQQMLVKATGQRRQQVQQVETEEATPDQLESALTRIAAAIDTQALDELAGMYKPVQWSKAQRTQVGEAFKSRRAAVKKTAEHHAGDYIQDGEDAHGLGHDEMGRDL